MSAPKPLFNLAELEAAAQLVHRMVPPTPQYAWPLLAKRTGCEVWVKHENHTPTCAFKVQGGIVYMDGLKRSRAKVTGVTTATRGNHGQSIAFSASRAGIPATIFVPRGNSADQNVAIRAFGAAVVEFGRDFDEALAKCHRVAREEGLHLKGGAARVLRLSEDDIAEAVRAYFQDTHNVAEGAGAAPLAALMQERARMSGKRVAVILSGGNIDASVYRRILLGETPKVS
jgi:threonine dehydratase